MNHRFVRFRAGSIGLHLVSLMSGFLDKLDRIPDRFPIKLVESIDPIRSDLDNLYPNTHSIKI